MYIIYIYIYCEIVMQTLPQLVCMAEQPGWSVVDQTSPFCTSTIMPDSHILDWVVLYVLLFIDECKFNMYKKRRRQEALRAITVIFGCGSVIVCGAVSQRCPGLLHMIHGWLKGPGYMDILDDSSAHPLDNGDNVYLLSRNGRHNKTSVRCAKILT